MAGQMATMCYSCMADHEAAGEPRTRTSIYTSPSGTYTRTQVKYAFARGGGSSTDVKDPDPDTTWRRGPAGAGMRGDGETGVQTVAAALQPQASFDAKHSLVQEQSAMEHSLVRVEVGSTAILTYARTQGSVTLSSAGAEADCWRMESCVPVVQTTTLELARPSGAQSDS
jgi:hypothetical protein